MTKNKENYFSPKQENYSSNTSAQPQLKKKIIEVGKFYLIHDGSKTGHPGLIIGKSDELNLYVAIKFGTTKNDNNFLLTQRPTPKTVNYMYKRLFVGKRKDFGTNEFTDFTITNEVLENYEIVKNNKYIYSANLPKKLKDSSIVKELLSIK